ncbi:putative monooxygenase p33MONOX [Pseudorasbora parva]|uniref:putative monooxygenase p33MONOX n=1 Tax=Pseudorasbora parva TaxID=51549 RepID=UPI00351EAB4B
MGGNEGGGRGGERWSLFGVRPIVQKSPTDPGSETNTPGGFTLQSYFGIQKSNTMDAIKTKINLTVEDPANFNSPKIEMGGEEGKKTSSHRLRHRDMNILTPSGF